MTASPTPAAELVEAFVTDVNGVPRGKWLPAEKLGHVVTKGVLMPRSVFAIDIWGRDADEAGLAHGTGDPDGVSFPIGEPLPVSWLGRPAKQVMLRMQDAEGGPFWGDPRTVLENVAARFAAAGLTPVTATELEFYLFQPPAQAGQPPLPMRAEPAGRWKGWHQDVLSLEALHRVAPVMDDIARFAAEQGIPTDGIVRENGPEQYELNIAHGSDVLAMADWTVMLKRIVRGAARRHGLDATFMAKPYGGLAGSGMHTHLSILDASGANIFLPAGTAPGGKLRQAVGGMLAAMQDSMLVLAPHANSYRRLTPAAHAPTRPSWGIDNRTAAVRAIEGGAATRIEHRVAGADSNPYLMLAVILASALYGLERGLAAPEPLAGEHSESDIAPLPATWDEALARFETSDFIAEAFGPRYRALFAAVKRQEIAEFRRHVTEVEYDAYLVSA